MFHVKHLFFLIIGLAIKDEMLYNMFILKKGDMILGKRIAIFNQKGGVGKTTTNINLAACLALKGKKTLVLDIDPQGNTTSGLGVSKRGLEDTVYNILVDKGYDIRNAIIKTDVENLDLIPASVDLAGAEVELVQVDQRETALKKGLEQIKGDYDYIFIDCPPSLGLLTINSLAAVDSVLIPIQPAGEHHRPG